MGAVSVSASDRRGQLLDRGNQEREQYGAQEQAAEHGVEPGLRHSGPDPRAPLRGGAR